MVRLILPSSANYVFQSIRKEEVVRLDASIGFSPTERAFKGLVGEVYPKLLLRILKVLQFIDKLLQLFEPTTNYLVVTMFHRKDNSLSVKRGNFPFLQLHNIPVPHGPRLTRLSALVLLCAPSVGGMVGGARLAPC